MSNPPVADGDATELQLRSELLVRLPVEGEREDRRRLDATGHELGDALNQHARLASPGRREHACLSAPVRDRTRLARIKRLTSRAPTFHRRRTLQQRGDLARAGVRVAHDLAAGEAHNLTDPHRHELTSRVAIPVVEGMAVRLDSESIAIRLDQKVDDEAADPHLRSCHHAFPLKPLLEKFLDGRERYLARQQVELAELLLGDRVRSEQLCDVLDVKPTNRRHIESPRL